MLREVVAAPMSGQASTPASPGLDPPAAAQFASPSAPALVPAVHSAGAGASRRQQRAGFRQVYSATQELEQALRRLHASFGGSNAARHGLNQWANHRANMPSNFDLLLEATASARRHLETAEVLLGEGDEHGAAAEGQVADQLYAMALDKMASELEASDLTDDTTEIGLDVLEAVGFLTIGVFTSGLAMPLLCGATLGFSKKVTRGALLGIEVTPWEAVAETLIASVKGLVWSKIGKFASDTIVHAVSHKLAARAWNGPYLTKVTAEGWRYYEHNPAYFAAKQEIHDKLSKVIPLIIAEALEDSVWNGDVDSYVDHVERKVVNKFAGKSLRELVEAVK